MALDKDIKKFLDNLENQHNPPYSSFKPAELRKWIDEQFYKKTKPEPIHVANVQEQHVPGPDGQLTCRLYYPEGERPFPALMYFHGGGYVIRDNMDLYDQTCRMMCANAHCVVIAVGYRLAPENPFPAAPEDCYAATCWVADNASKLNIDANHFGVWGESCGGALATVIPMMARDRQGPKLACQIIVTPMLDYNFDTESYAENGQGGYLLTQDSMEWFWKHYVAGKEDAKNPYCAPSQATDLKNLPPALMVTVQYDPLRDEGKQYADQLKSAGVKTEYQCYPSLIHTFFDLYTISEAANHACLDIIKKAKKMLS